MKRLRSELASGTSLAAIGLGCLLVFAGAVALHVPNVGHELVYDDHAVIENNPRIRSLASWDEIFTTPWRGRERNDGLYRPVTLLSYAVDFETHRLSPGPYHFWNDFLHGLNSALVLILAWLSFRSLSASLIAGGLFALHPIHGEAVHWVVGRAELLAAFFTMVALWLVLSDVAIRKLRVGLASALAAASCLLAILSKENGAVAFAALPLAILLIRQPEGGATGKWRALWTGRGRLLLILLGTSGLVWMLLRRNALGADVLPIPPADNPLAYGSTAERIGTALSLVPLWLGKLVLPTSLSVDYGPPRIPVVQLPGDGQAWLGVAVLAVLLTSLWICRKRAPAVAFWIGFLLLAWLPTSNLLFPAGVVFSERALYMPSIASCVLTGFALSRVRIRALGWGAAALLAGVYLATTVQRTGDWRNDTALFQHEMQLQPPGMKSQRNYAKLIEKTDPKRAEQLYRDLVSRFPAYAEARVGFGTFLLGQGNPAAALEQLEEANRLDPGDPLILLNLGAAHAGVRQWSRAAECWERVLQMDPENRIAKGNLEAVRNR